MSKYITLTQGKQTLVDDDDFESLSQCKWFYGNGYAARGNGHDTTLMHRVINKTPKGYHTDHINHDKLDNRRENLRTVTNQENQFNALIARNNISGYRGVCWSERDKRFRATAKLNGIKLHIGNFKTLEQVVEARQIWELSNNVINNRGGAK